jgi:hypothetical protein
VDVTLGIIVATNGRIHAELVSELGFVSSRG